MRRTFTKVVRNRMRRARKARSRLRKRFMRAVAALEEKIREVRAEVYEQQRKDERAA